MTRRLPSTGLFAYPNGQPSDYTPATVDILRDAGIRAAVTTIPGINESATPPFELRRFGIGAADTDEQFAAIVEARTH
jgi:hypothetical protein